MACVSATAAILILTAKLTLKKDRVGEPVAGSSSVV
jgi:hypothetical protein